MTRGMAWRLILINKLLTVVLTDAPGHHQDGVLGCVLPEPGAGVLCPPRPQRRQVRERSLVR